MNKRWILALTAAVGIGLLAVPLFVKRSRRRRRAAERDRSAEPPSLDSSKASPACKPSSRAKLDFALKDTNGADVAPGGLQGQGGAAQLLGDVVRPVQGRDPRVRRAVLRNTRIAGS